MIQWKPIQPAALRTDLPLVHHFAVPGIHREHLEVVIFISCDRWKSLDGGRHVGPLRPGIDAFFARLPAMHQRGAVGIDGEYFHAALAGRSQRQAGFGLRSEIEPRCPLAAVGRIHLANSIDGCVRAIDRKPFDRPHYIFAYREPFANTSSQISPFRPMTAGVGSVLPAMHQRIAGFIDSKKLQPSVFVSCYRQPWAHSPAHARPGRPSIVCRGLPQMPHGAVGRVHCKHLKSPIHICADCNRRANGTAEIRPARPLEAVCLPLFYIAKSLVRAIHREHLHAARGIIRHRQAGKKSCAKSSPG